jgi:hypothetical protein
VCRTEFTAPPPATGPLTTRPRTRLSPQNSAACAADAPARVALLLRTAAALLRAPDAALDALEAAAAAGAPRALQVVLGSGQLEEHMRM